ncbi:GAF domain-containing protein [Calidifontibacillus oryziterrae]|uniref:GAF domain-containing protein n=1 Tax=Calidifontibacillus oryziterrae TaxID=1191699 RepID=UPI00031988CB|nr:GAF domain-containing protein [Calidifontibacillus oryziterrae]
MEELLNTKLKRFDVLLNAIDFFTQRFHVEQIMEFGYRFVNELLTLESSALFIREGNSFVMKTENGYHVNQYSLTSTKKLDEIPLFHGHIITTNLQSYFPAETIELFSIRLVVPLIIDTELAGFIVSKGKKNSELDSDDLSMVDYLMKLINHSLENNQRFLDFQKINSDLDRKIFNLFVINQSTKALLSELRLGNLYSNATDVFSEVSGSKVTSFGIFDPLTNKIKISGYRNVNSFSVYYTELELKERKYASPNIVLHIKEDLDLIKSLFVNWQEFENLDAQYIVLIVKDEILGVVTISEAVNGVSYSRADFELIESLAATTYIAITNAKLFNEIKAQKEEIEKKYKALSMLNKLSRTINSGKTKDELFSLTLQTLQLGYGVKKAFFSVRSKNNDYIIIKSVGLDDVDGQNYQIPQNVKDKLTIETYYNYESIRVSDYFTNHKLIEKFGDVNGIVLSPLFMENKLQLSKETIDGYLVVIETNDNLKEEEILIIDTITKNISPILYQMHEKDELKKQYTMDYKQLFISALEQKIDYFQKYSIDFYVYFKQVHPSIFMKAKFNRDELQIEHDDSEVFEIDNYIFIISSSSTPNLSNDWQMIKNPMDCREVIDEPFAKI